MTNLHHNLLPEDHIILVREDITQRKIYAISKSSTLRVFNISNGICLQEFEHDVLQFDSKKENAESS